MDKLFRALNSPDLDEFTRKEILRFAERKLDEHLKFRGQIARDLRRISPDAFTQPAAYNLLRKKYLRAHASKTKLAILELEKFKWCKGELL